MVRVWAHNHQRRRRRPALERASAPACVPRLGQAPPRQPRHTQPRGHLPSHACAKRHASSPTQPLPPPQLCCPRGLWWAMRALPSAVQDAGGFFGCRPGPAAVTGTRVGVALSMVRRAPAPGCLRRPPSPSPGRAIAARRDHPWVFTATDSLIMVPVSESGD